MMQVSLHPVARAGAELMDQEGWTGPSWGIMCHVAERVSRGWWMVWASEITMRVVWVY